MMIYSERLIIVSLNKELLFYILENKDKELKNKGLVFEKWPSQDTMEFLYLIRDNLNYDLVGFDIWILIEKEKFNIVGDISFKDLPNENGELEIVCAVVDTYRNKGYATEGLKRLIKWAFSRCEVNMITAECLSDNKASIRVLEKIGMKRICECSGVIYWSMLKA